MMPAFLKHNIYDIGKMTKIIMTSRREEIAYVSFPVTSEPVT